MKRRLPDGKLMDTSTTVLTFDTSTLPTQVKICFQYVDVVPFIPEPMRCFHCQRFSHLSGRCPEKEKPGICTCGGLMIRDGDHVCENPPKCRNCDGDHRSNFKKCPVYMQEYKIEQVRVVDNISYAAARKQVMAGSMTKNGTYSQVTATQRRTLPEQPPPPALFNADQLIAALKPLLKALVADAVTECLRALLAPGSLLTHARGGSTDSLTSLSKRKPVDNADSSNDSSTNLHDSRPMKRSKKKKSSPKKGGIPKLTLKRVASQELPSTAFNSSSNTLMYVDDNDLSNPANLKFSERLYVKE